MDGASHPEGGAILAAAGFTGTKSRTVSSHMWAMGEGLREIWVIDNTNQALMN